MSTLFVPPLCGGMEIIMKLRAVIFDLDGTLMDTLGDIAAGVSFALRQAGRKVPTLAEYRTFIGDGPKVLIQRALGEKIPEAEFEALYRCYFDYYCRHPSENTTVYPEIIPVLECCAAAGLKMAVNTNKQEVLARLLIREKLPDYPFSLILGQTENRPLKPDPSAALLIADAFHADPGEILFIGDSFQDVQTAKNAGMIPYSVLWGYQSESMIRENGGEHFFQHGDELAEAITRILC